jgi:hypothetical protein
MRFNTNAESITGQNVKEISGFIVAVLMKVVDSSVQ